MRLDQLNGLIALAKVAEKQSFSRAALELRVSPSALSQSVRQLEQRLGVALLARTTRNTSLTEAGRRFLERAGPALDEILASVEMVEHYAKAPSGLLRLTLPAIGYARIIEPMIAGFIERYPQVQVELSMTDDYVDIIEQGFDAGIRFGEAVSRDMTSLRLTPSLTWVIAGAPRYFAKHGHPKKPEDLLEHACIRYRFPNGELYEDFEFVRGKREFTVRVQGPLIVNEPTSAISAGLKGLGLVYQEEHAIGRHLRSGKLVPTLQAFMPKSEGYFLYFPSRSQVQPKLRAFIDFLRASA